MNLISDIVFRDNEKKKISVTLSGFLSTLIGNTLAGHQEPIPFLKISMKEIRKIAKNSTLILHGWLSSQLQPKQSKTVPIDFLTHSLIWDKQDHTTICSVTLRKRKHPLLNEIIPDLQDAGWKCTEYPTKITFVRPESGDYHDVAEKPFEILPECVEEGIISFFEEEEKTVDTGRKMEFV